MRSIGQNWQLLPPRLLLVVIVEIFHGSVAEAIVIRGVAVSLHSLAVVRVVQVATGRDWNLLPGWAGGNGASGCVKGSVR